MSIDEDADSYRTISSPASAKFTEKMSRFLSFAHQVDDTSQVRELVSKYQKEYHDARHVCWAYVVGTDRSEQYSNDNGEPSGTAGKPILGQINSLNLTNVVVVVVRYFGGIKLGTPGLIAAYREAARLALDEAPQVTRHAMQSLTFTFPYQSMNAVMTVAKMPEIETIDRQFDCTCRMTLATRAGLMTELISRISAIDGTSILP
ncbi:MAG: IMPACT family protein [Muribaculaceae bacterium]|nr:IMPACT family protein [Muribaculaceae bacterium]